MGIKLDKIESIDMGDSFAFRTSNAAQVGICYVCVLNQGESSTKQRHHSLFIDVAGRSRYDHLGKICELIGLMLHVTAKPQTGKTKYRHGTMKILGKKDQIYTVGQKIQILIHSNQLDGHFTCVCWSVVSFRNPVGS